MVRVRDSIFGSNWERRLYRALESAWPGKLDIYPNLPFLNVIDWSGIRVNDKERSFLKATSIDFTACLHGSERPALSVEFDGLGHGYSHGDRYVRRAPTSDPFRAEKLALKLRIAADLAYPYFVVSYDEADSLVVDDKLTITHGIVGDCMKHKFMQSAIDERAGGVDFAAYAPDEQDEIAQNILVDVETELEFEWNPLARAAACAMSDALDAGMESFQIEGITDPPLATLGSSPSVEQIQHNVHLMFSARRHGSRVTAEGRGTSVTKEAWLHNIEGPGVFAFSIIEDVTRFLCFRQFLTAVGRGGKPGRHWR